MPSRKAGPRSTAKFPTLVKDDDLLTPTHDEILRWLRANVGAVLGSPEHWMWEPEGVEALRGRAARTISERVADIARRIEESDRRRGEQGTRRLKGEEARRAEEHIFAERGVTGRKHMRETGRLKKLLRSYYLTDDVAYAAAKRLHAALQSVALPEAPPPYPGIAVVEAMLQKPIYFPERPGRGRRESQPRFAGYIDLALTYRRPRLCYTLRNIEVTEALEGATPDAVWRTELTKGAYVICYDVRASIPSIGGLIRELRAAHEALPQGAACIVVTPSDEFEEVLTDQGFGFLKYEPDFLNELADDERFTAPTNGGQSTVREFEGDDHVERIEPEPPIEVYEELDMTGFEGGYLDVGARRL